MRLLLTGLHTLAPMPEEPPAVIPGYKTLKVLYCAVCRTDAKMWNEGHRDLVFPRVPGHEFVATDQDSRRYTVWPGTTCGHCAHCLRGNENLCEEMKITGFHHDGGFADHVIVPEDSLIPVPQGASDHLVTFAEPVGCVHHALGKIQAIQGQRIIIFGGGTLGLLTALVAKSNGLSPTVIEKNSAKIEKALPFLEKAAIPCVKETNDSEFDLAVNACPDVIAFSLCVSKLGKGGKLAFFSGLKKNETLESNLINLMHYKEVELYGAYGLTRRDMIVSLDFIGSREDLLEHLVEAIIPPDQAPGIMPSVLEGKAFKYILDFTGTRKHSTQTLVDHPSVRPSAANKARSQSADLAKVLSALPCPIEPVGDDLRAEAQFAMDDKAKPLGSLGKLEDLAVRLAVIQQTLRPQLERKALLIFAGDHGITESGVSAYPAEVTGQMVRNFLNGGAAINVLARHHGIDLAIVDMGVNADFDPHLQLIEKKIRKATRNFAIEPAMTAEEAVAALHSGMEAFFDFHAQSPIAILGVGEMGIGNTTSASAIICSITGILPKAATGRGTGVDDKGLKHKTETLEKALAYLKPDPTNGMDILRKVGGFEIAGIAGAILAAASQRTAVVLDGVISTAAGLIAYMINPDVSGYLIASHKSVEIAHQSALNYLGLDPLIDFNLRLGEGTGAALVIDLASAACAIMGQMATFDEAGVSKKN